MNNPVKKPILSRLVDQLVSRIRVQEENARILASLLKELKQGRDILQLDIENEDRVCSAQVEAYVLDHNMLVLGDIMPHSRIEALKRGRKCKLSIFGDSSGISIPCNYLEPLVSCSSWMKSAQRFHQFTIKASKFSLSEQVFLKFLAGNRLAHNIYSGQRVQSEVKATGVRVA